MITAIYYVFPLLSLRLRKNKNEVTILVLGDLGHSPRMCYHALSLARADMLVNLCGYMDMDLPESIQEEVMIDVYPIKVIKNTRMLPFIAFAAYKVAMQLYQLFALLLKVQGSKYYMLQNPPSMPLLLVLVVFIRIFSPRSKLIIDWHNLNYTILNLKFNNLKHPLVRVLRAYERILAQFAAINITVTQQMKEFLIKEFLLREDSIIPFHDRPGPQFRPLRDLTITKSEILATRDLFSEIDNIADYKILVSATSFTPDEDFSILLNALKLYDDNKNEKTPIFAIITGKGPMQKQFLESVSSLNFTKKVIIRNAWLSAEDYPLVLACADVAVSLHTSLSGIDLPMKIVDFFGVGVPVLTLRFPAIGELVQDGKNGLILPGIKLEDQEMYDGLTRVLNDSGILNKLKDGALAESEKRWDENWDRILHPALCN